MMQLMPLNTVMDPVTNPDADLVNALAKGLDLLSIFAAGELLGNQHIAQRTGLAKATVSRLTNTLAARGYLRLDLDERKYAIGPRFLAVSACVQHRLGLSTVARKHMQAFVDAHGICVGLGTRDRLGLVCLDALRPSGVPLGNATVGIVWPIPTTAIGLSYLASATLKERTLLLKQLQLRHGSQWPPLREKVYQALLQFQQRGFVSLEQSCEAHVCAAAVSRRLPRLNGVFSFNCAMHNAELSHPRQLQALGQRLLHMVQAIEHDLHIYTTQ